MKTNILTFMVLIAVAVRLAQAVNISGVVKNSGGSAVDGAMVRLGKANISTTTGADGSFKLMGNMTGIKYQINHTAFSGERPFILENNRLIITATKQAEVTMKVYDCNGKLLASLSTIASGKDHAIALPSFACGIHVYRVFLNAEEYSFTSVAGIASHTTKGSAWNMIAPARQAKVAGQIDDALLFTKTGYQLYRLPIKQTDTSGIQATLTALVTGTVTDADGNSYQTVQYGKQTWTIENLRTTKYNDGSSIGSNYCFYNNTTDAAAKKKWGALYNSSAATSSKLAPTGWHVPTDGEWDTLQKYLIAQGYNYDGTTSGNKIAKSMAAATDWTTDSIDTGAIGKNLSANNASGFSAMPAGFRLFDGTFMDQGADAYWWASTSSSGGMQWTRLLFYTNLDLYRGDRVTSTLLSIRIVKNN